MRWSNHASADAAARIDPAFFARVDSVVDAPAGPRRTAVLLNMHHYRQLDGDTLDPGEARRGRPRRGAAALPGDVAADRRALCRSRSPRLLFEIYNEPHGALEPQWNDLLSRASVRVIRQRNPERACWSSVPRCGTTPTRLIAACACRPMTAT